MHFVSLYVKNTGGEAARTDDTKALQSGTASALPVIGINGGGMDTIIRNATIAGMYRTKDIGIRKGRIVAINDHIEALGGEEIDAQGYLVSPSFIDVHMHIDKALILDRYDWSEREQHPTLRLTSIYKTNKIKKKLK